MKKKSIQYIVIIAITILIWSCSTKKNTFLSRNIHTVSTKYNILYNGNVAFDTAKKQIDDAYEDNFLNILPIEPLKIDEKFELPGPPGSKQSTNSSTTATASGFKLAEEKAVKAVQKHSMNIGASEKNKQIDDAYLLLGKSRYFDQRFIPAMETFQYMIKKYPKSKIFNSARIWEAKTLIRLGQEEDAIYKLEQYLTKTADLPNKIRENAHTALAMAYTKQDSTQQVINHLNKSLLYSKKNYHQETRNSFVLAQLYRQQQKIDSSNVVFEKIAKYKKAPYRYQIYAQIERAKNYNKKNDDSETMLTLLEKMTRNRDNRPYLDGLFFQIGKINLKNDSIDKALHFFKESINTKLAKNIQKNYAYEEVGNIYFDKANFKNAGAYYDSVLNIAENKNSKRIRKLKRKRKSLNEVIRLENIATRNDSIMNLVAMTKEEQTTFFNDHIKKLKKIEKEAEIIAENERKAAGFTGFGDNKNGGSGSSFYFYNTQSVGFGKQEFQSIWGNRVLEDNWRLSTKKAIREQGDNENEEVTESEEIDESRKYELAYYLENIPNEEKVLDSISSKRNKAYYNLGLIYKEQFNKYKLATERLEKLLTQSPKEKLILPTYYHLYKSFDHFDKVKSDYYKDKITTDYPKSRYAQIINNPDISVDELNDVGSPEKIYETVYTLYNDEKYQETLNECNKHIKQYSDTSIIPKFELLKAHAIAKLKGKGDFIKALNFVLVNYPNTEEGKRAAEILAFLRGDKVIKKEKDLKPDTKEKKSKSKRKNKLPSKKEMMEKIKKGREGKIISPPGVGG